MKITCVLVSSMGRPRQEDKMTFDPCMSGFGSGIWQVTIAEKGDEENVLKFGHITFKVHGRFPSLLTSSDTHVSDLTVAESAGLKSILVIHKLLAWVSDRMN